MSYIAVVSGSAAVEVAKGLYLIVDGRGHAFYIERRGPVDLIGELELLFGILRHGGSPLSYAA